MNHLKCLATIALFMILFNGIQAQEHTRNQFYIKAAGGYFFSVSNGQFPNVGPYPPHDENVAINPGTGATTTLRQKVLTGSYGEGVRGGLTAGYVINKYFSVEATFNYFHSAKTS
ncbi:hypothetical protein [Paraflavitalea speifideaquila]|uniref:hypothetical protein n=1 Tax=Paraflavitalea speifideaquila TaxID=3076558 RepID=UPI0028E75A35|nr:hypothetical protein [Paraflavitalea speifideiaquila]